MDERIAELDWSLLRAFLAVAESGSLSAAARRLGISQPTLGRQVRALEEALGAALFTRHARGLVPTETGAALVAPAREMREAAQRIALAAAGRDTGLRGTVRITASMFMAHHVLPRVLAGIRAEAPEIELELVPSDASENLLFREADIAVRMYRSDQLDIVTRHLGDIPLGIFAARSYLDRRGRPARLDDLPDHDLVGYDANPLILRSMREMGWPAERGWFALRCDDQAAYWELVRAGCGIGFGQLAVGRADPLLEELLPGSGLPTLPLWLAAPEAMRRTSRITFVWERLAEGLRAALRLA
ncbi:MAG: LysR family transcriptional regulator [Paracoccaceae bacterium]